LNTNPSLNTPVPEQRGGGRGVQFSHDKTVLGSGFVEPYRGDYVMVGDAFYLRGDQTKPNRIWKIVKTGDKFMTIETKDKQFLPPGQDIRVVTAEDILSVKALPVAQAFSQAQAFPQEQAFLQPQALGNPTGGIGFMPQQSPANNIEIHVVQGDDKSHNMKPLGLSTVMEGGVTESSNNNKSSEDSKHGIKIQKLGM